MSPRPRSADAAPPERSTVVTRAISRPATLLLLAVMLAVAIGAFSSRSTTDPVGADAPPQAFSADRARAVLEPVAGEPRPIGTPANDRAREHLSTELADLGFEVETLEQLGVRSGGTEARAGYVRNLVATRPGSDPTGTLVLATHIDSVPQAPGAADAGIGIAVILETVRALGPEALRNDLVVLLVDGEEEGLLGAQAVVDEDAAGLTDPVLVLNHEARGIEGRPLVTRSHGPVHPLLSAMPRPEAESYIDALFQIIPNDTDFTVYREAGWWGMDMAIIDGSWAYHSPQDDLAHLDDATLQHYGDLTLALTRAAADRDLGALAAEAGQQPVMTTSAVGILRIPPPVITILGILAPLALLAAAVVLRRRGALRLSGTLLGVLAGVLALVAAPVAATLLWRASAALFPGMLSVTVGEPVHAELFLAAEISATLAVLALAWVLVRRGIHPAAACLGAALPATVLVGVLAVMAPALLGWMVLPVAAAAIGGLLAVLVPPAAAPVARAAGILPTGWMLGQQTSGLLEFGIASAAGGMAATAAIGLLAAAALLLPARGARAAVGGAEGAGGEVGPPRRLRTIHLLVPAALAVLTLVASGAGIWRATTAGEPAQSTVSARIDAATGATRWQAQGGTDWAESMDGREGTSQLPGPQVEVTELAGDRLRLDITSRRDAARLQVSAPSGPAGDPGVLGDLSIDGTGVGGEEITTLGVVGVRPGQTVRVEMSVPRDRHPLEVTDASLDLTEAGGYLEPPADVSVVRSLVHVTTRVQL